MTPPLPIDRNSWFRRVLNVAPRLPAPMVSFLAVALTDPGASSDSLLWIADALEQAATDSRINGRPHQADELHAVADLPRQLAPLRAWQTHPRIDTHFDPSTDLGTVEGIIEPDGTVTVTVPAAGRAFALLRGLPLRLRRSPWVRRASSEPKG